LLTRLKSNVALPIQNKTATVLTLAAPIANEVMKPPEDRKSKDREDPKQMLLALGFYSGHLHIEQCHGLEHLDISIEQRLVETDIGNRSTTWFARYGWR
jgi:hypothetical protein